MSYPHFPMGNIPTTLPEIEKNMSKSVSCPKCSGLGVFIDHGPTVGRGWFCRGCKDDIDHSDNMYGLTADQMRKAKARQPGSLIQPLNMSAGYGAHPSPYSFEPLECVKLGCKLCGTISRNPSHHGVMLGIPKSPVVLRIGDVLRCDHDKGVTGFLKANDNYEVAEVLAFTVRIWVSHSVQGTRVREKREYTRCRFSLVKRVP